MQKEFTFSQNSQKTKKQNGQIHVGDCLEIMKTMESESVGMVVTSPPYNLLNTTGSWPEKGGVWGCAKIKDGYDGTADNVPREEYVEFHRKTLKEMMRIIKPDGVIFYNHKWRVQAGLIQDQSEILEGFPVRQIIIWDKCGSINVSNSFFLPNYEVIYMIAKSKFMLKKKASSLGCIWRVPPDQHNDHPAPYPVEIPYLCISSTNCDSVLDPFMGSGTTAIAAEMAGVIWVGIERSEKYAESASMRVSSFLAMQ